jgi:hypothetical protein
VAFTCTGFGVTGVVASQLPGSTATNLVASAAIGLAAGAIHPELLRAAQGRNTGRETTSPNEPSPN